MVLQFQPPPEDLLRDYLNRPSPGQQASDSINQALQTYVQAKQAEHKSKNEALQTLLKASDSVDLSDPTTAKAFAPLYKDAGVDPSIFQPPVKSTAAAPSPQASPLAVTPVEQSAQQSLPSEHPTDVPPAISPIVQASLAAGHPDHSGVMASVGDPNQLIKTGFGRKKLAAAESAQKLTDAQQAKADKDAENAPVSFDYARAKAKASDAPNAADPFIEIAQKEGRTNLSRKEMADLKDAISARASSLRGGAFDSMAATREAMLRESLNKDARATINPFFQTGPGKEQVTRLNSIGRAEPLIQQMSAQKNGGDPRQMRELATSMNKVITGSGVGAEGQIEGLIPQTSRGKFANWQEFLTNNPAGTDQQAFIKRFGETLSREKQAITGQIKNQAEANAPTLRLLKEHYPQDYQAQIDSVLNNPSLVGTPQPPSNNGWSYVGKAQ